ncbi:YybH family protein [Shewanella surugensis]|uniref:Nuclear transport factor 2 family protein n=1 Tax=Shewanella surugensis TaxID=212020 RepID=A0ABT0L9B4_9GAMM|nr:nuclear transport factor 2 family protein [Shewanella surugensis]MCL1124294.1 nuclear transport factor 2 family protein [Shewanella surugensis]
MRHRKIISLGIGLLLAACTSISSLAWAHGNEPHDNGPAAFIGENLPAAKVVKQFHRALKASDEAGVKQVLATDVLIYEGGSVEPSLAVYASGHLQADMAYLKGLTINLKERQVRVTGDIAIATSVSHVVGEYKGKKVDSTNMETLVLKRQSDNTWKIVHIHWS